MISEWLGQFSIMIETMSGGNQMIAGAISLWLLGTGTWFLRNIPMSIWGFIKRNIITSMTMNNGGWHEAATMTNFICWLQPRMKDSMSRTLSVDTGNRHVGLDEDEAKVNVGIGYGVHFFFYNKRLFWLNKNKLDSSGSERQKEEISISTFGRSHKVFHQIVDDFKPKVDEGKLKMYKFSVHGEWEMFTTTSKRDLQSVAIPREIKDSVVGQIQYFKDNKDWFYRSGLPHKLTYLLSGKPGGGKTSLIKAIASHFGMNVCIINVSQVSDGMLEQALATTPKNSLVLMEDFDSSSASKNRKPVVEKESKGSFEDYSPLTLSGLLNALDGIVPMDDCVLFMTTNHLEKIDEAVYRKGRTDHLIEINEIGDIEIKDYIKHIFPDYDTDGLVFSSMMGCKLNEALLYSRDDPDKFIEKLQEEGLCQKS